MGYQSGALWDGRRSVVRQRAPDMRANGVDAGIVKVEDFLGKLKQDYIYSVQKAASVKIGDQRLIQGGAKTKKIQK